MKISHRLEQIREVVDEILKEQPIEENLSIGTTHLYGVSAISSMLHDISPIVEE